MIRTLFVFTAGISSCNGIEYEDEDIKLNVIVEFEDINECVKAIYSNGRILFGNTISNGNYYMQFNHCEYITNREDTDNITDFHLLFSQFIIEKFYEKANKHCKEFDFYLDECNIFDYPEVYLLKGEENKINQFPIFSNNIRIKEIYDYDLILIITNKNQIYKK